MKSNHPPTELPHSANIAGPLLKIVLDEHRKNPDQPDPTKEEVLAVWQRHDCQNVNLLIANVARRPVLLEWGGSFNLDSSAGKLPTTGSVGKLQSIYIGNHREGIRPLRWLLYLGRGFDAVPAEQRQAFDKIAGRLLASTSHNGADAPDPILGRHSP